MQIDEGGGKELRARRFMIAVEPPGNIARDMALYRGALFAAAGDPSCRFLPELIPLALSVPASGGLPPESEVRISLRKAWDGIEGDFRSLSIIDVAGFLYLKVEGPLGALASRAAGILSPIEAEGGCTSGIAPGIGFFLCGAGSKPGGHISPPEARFLDASLVLYRLSFGEDPLRAVSWRLLARAGRLTGARNGRITGMTRRSPGPARRP